MSEEIKEILDYIDNRIIPNEKWNKIKDYITKSKNCFEEKLRNEKAIEYIIENCVLSDEWKDLGFCNFIPTGRIEYKQLSKTKVKYLLKILKGDKDE